MGRRNSPASTLPYFGRHGFGSGSFMAESVPYRRSLPQGHLPIALPIGCDRTDVRLTIQSVIGLKASGLQAKMPRTWDGSDPLGPYKVVGIETAENHQV